MVLRDRVQESLKAAMKEGKKDETSTLRMVWAALRNEEIAVQHPLDDVEVERVIARQVKQLTEASVDFTRGGRSDLVADAEVEIAYLKGFLPAPLTDTELRALIIETMKNMEGPAAKDVGRITGAAMKVVAGRANGNRVREIVASLLM